MFSCVFELCLSFVSEQVIGDNNLIMGSCHIAHDCKIGDRNIFANNTLLAGHVIVEVSSSFCVYTSNLDLASMVSFGSCCECLRTIHTQQELRSSTSSVILVLLLSLVVVLWYIFIILSLPPQIFQWILTGEIVYRFHKMFQST